MKFNTVNEVSNDKNCNISVSKFIFSVLLEIDSIPYV